MGVTPVHLALLEQGEVGLEATPGPHVLQGVEDLLVGAVLLWRGRRNPEPCVSQLLTPCLVAHRTYLVSKLVTGEAQHDQPPRVAGLELVELGVIPHRGASERSHVLDQDHAAPENTKIHFFPLQGGGAQVIEGLGDGDGHGCRRAAGCAPCPAPPLKGFPVLTSWSKGLQAPPRLRRNLSRPSHPWKEEGGTGPRRCSTCLNNSWHGALRLLILLPARCGMLPAWHGMFPRVGNDGESWGITGVRE